LKKYNTLPKDLQAILITAMKLSAYDMYAHSNDASAKNWATMKKDYPNIKVKTFPKPVFDALRAANDKSNSHQIDHDKQNHLLMGVCLNT
jgi:TRAP-type mannitol/chloroaromatic compound transport system substrate-binding protein